MRHTAKVFFGDGKWHCAASCVAFITAAFACYLRGQPKVALAMCCAAPISSFALFFHHMVQSTLHHMGSSGDKLRMMSAREIATELYGFFSLRGISEMVWATRFRLSGAALAVGQPAPDACIHPLAGSDRGISLHSLITHARPLVLNFGSCT